MTRIKAFLIHLGISVSIISFFFIIVYFIWYPEPFFYLDASWMVLRVVVFMDLILGPVLTLIVFKPGKPGLKFDMAFIITMQLASLSWGSWVAYNERPHFFVFNVDRFTVAGYKDLYQPEETLDKSAYVKPWVGPLWIYAKRPEDIDSRSKLFESVIDGAPDLPFRPEYYENLDNYNNAIAERTIDLEKRFGKGDDRFSVVNSYFQEQSISKKQVILIAAEGRKNDAVLVLERGTGRYLGYIPVWPW